MLDQNMCNQLPTIATQHDRRTKAIYKLSACVLVFHHENVGA